MQVLYKGGALFDGENAPVEGHGVMVEGDKVVRVAPNAEFEGFAGTAVDTAGGTLMPGLIDCHVHLCLGAEGDPGGTDGAEEAEGAEYPELAPERVTYAGGCAPPERTIEGVRCRFHIR